MATLAAALEMRKKLVQEQKAEAAKERRRNIADPSISVNDICNTLDAFMKHHKCDDLWRLICTPQGVINVTWQSPVNPEWVVKLSGLAFDIFDFAKNTKLLAARVKKALVALHDQRNLTLPQYLGQKDDAMDQIDMKLRIGLNMFRELKKSATARSRVFRVLTCDEQAQIQMCLDKILLDDSIEGDEDKPTVSPPVRTSSPPVLALPAPEVETPARSLVPAQTASNQCLRRSLQFSPSALDQISDTPAIFGKILAGQKSCVEKNSCMEQARKPAQVLTDAQIIEGAMGFVPTQVEGKKKQSGSKQKKNKKKKNQKKNGKDQKKSQKKENQKKDKCGKAEEKKRTFQSTAAAKTSQKKHAPLSPDYVIADMPTMEDTYRNLCVSRHWHRADQLAKKCGLSKEERIKRRCKASEEAGKIWDDLHPN